MYSTVPAVVSLLTLAFTGHAPNSGLGIGRCLCLPPDDYISATFESVLECDVIGAGLTETTAAVALPRVSLSCAAIPLSSSLISHKESVLWPVPLFVMSSQ